MLYKRILMQIYKIDTEKQSFFSVLITNLSIYKTVHLTNFNVKNNPKNMVFLLVLIVQEFSTYNILFVFFHTHIKM